MATKFLTQFQVGYISLMSMDKITKGGLRFPRSKSYRKFQLFVIETLLAAANGLVLTDLQNEVIKVAKFYGL